MAGGGAPLRRELRARAQPSTRAAAGRAFHAQTLATRPAGLPEINLEHLQAMTDDTGMLQHAIFSVPRYDDGYCLDDNARALLLMALLEDAGADDADSWSARSPRATWRSSVMPSIATTGRFRNFMSYARHWLEALRLGRQPRARAVGARRRRRPRGRSRAGTVSPASCSTPRCPR